MDLKKDVDRLGKDLKDTADEVKHRFKAGEERGKREAAGDEMTTTEKVESALKEAGHETAAEFDKTKREVRDNT
jgi:hypothetical protein